ncbi:Hypothetical predicted protein [Octopus vulgaris]|uniref:Uncharacterized protein n=1 Tax=Octopus vulgaris TaxID=6645 RepID=A0AA36EVN5_OCTVU|nr:Hypothetical predicted protein [Octopus vulgaris]
MENLVLTITSFPSTKRSNILYISALKSVSTSKIQICSSFKHEEKINCGSSSFTLFNALLRNAYCIHEIPDWMPRSDAFNCRHQVVIYVNENGLAVN